MLLKLTWMDFFTSSFINFVGGVGMGALQFLLSGHMI